MLLSNVITIHENQPINIAVSGERIAAAGAGIDTGHFHIHFTDAMAFPGLINSHDHLDFNCFSPFGQRKYKNYTEWGNHIHEVYKEDITAVLKIPQHLRTAWGMYKNLLAGVTTVVNHGAVLKIENPLVTVYQQLQNLHSVKFQRQWKWKLNSLLAKNKTCVIHAGEGVDDASHNEINELLKWNLLNRKLVGVHGVAMDTQQAKGFTALVWCPESNQLLLEKHADISRLKNATNIVFGTDSALTGNWNIWQHLRFARTLQQGSDTELLGMVTNAPAALWDLNNGELLPGRDADIVIAKKKKDLTAWDGFFAIDPEDILMILHKGKIRLFDKTLMPQLVRLSFDISRFSAVNINGAVKCVEGDLPALMSAIREYKPGIVFPVDACTTTRMGIHG